MPTDQEKVQAANQKRDLLQGQLRDRMRKSIAEQGAWGVRQTTMWARKYRLAQLCIGRENADTGHVLGPACVSPLVSGRELQTLMEAFGVQHGVQFKAWEGEQ